VRLFGGDRTPDVVKARNERRARHQARRKRNRDARNLCQNDSTKSGVPQNRRGTAANGRPSHCWLVTFFWAIIFRVNRSPSTVNW